MPSYEHLITGNNLKRFDQMLELERKFKENKQKDTERRDVITKEGKENKIRKGKKDGKDGKDKNSDGSDKPQAVNNSTGFSYKPAD